MQSKSLMLKSAVIAGVFALLASGAALAGTDAAAPGAPVTVVSSDAELNETVDKMDIDDGAKDSVDDGAKENVEDGAKDGVEDVAKNEVEVDNEVKDGTTGPATDGG